MKKKFFVSLLLVLAIAISLIPTALASSGTCYESEPNDSLSQAGLTANDYDNYGRITTGDDVDWWAVQFSYSGSANFWLGNVPSNCDFDLKVYNYSGTLLGSSLNNGNANELITFNVTAYTRYYIKIYGYGATSNSYYLMRAKVYPSASGAKYYLVTSDNLGYGQTHVDNTVSHLTNLGHVCTQIDKPTANTVYTNLPVNCVTVIHGHGNKGVISCKQTNGTTQYLYSSGSSTPCVNNHPSGTLGSVKLIIFITCHSGVGTDDSTSSGFVDVANSKGAKVSLGFKNEVAGGEWWVDYFTNSLSFYSFDSAAYLADASFAYYLPGISGKSNSPDNANNQYMVGDIYSYL